MAQRSRPTGRHDVVDALLDAAARLLAERNPASVSVREIADTAGVNHGLVHHYFGGKPQLIVAVLDRKARALADTIAPDTDGPTALRSMFLGPDAQSFARLVAYARVEGWIGAGELEGAVTRRLIEIARNGDAPTLDERRLRLRVAGVLALMLGWELFRPTVVGLTGLDETDVDDDELVEIAATLLAGQPSLTPE